MKLGRFRASLPPWSYYWYAIKRTIKNVYYNYKVKWNDSNQSCWFIYASMNCQGRQKIGTVN